MRHRLVTGLAALLLLLEPAGTARGEEAPAELSRAVRALGAPSTLWGRLAVEEESPEGAWTPLAGVAVTLYPYTAGLVADLERIREFARASGRDYDAAVARLQERLGAHAAQLAALAGEPAPEPARPEAKPPPAGRDRIPARGAPSGALPGRAGPAARDADPAPAGEKGKDDAPPSSAGGLIRRATTDPSGLFLFGALPAGDWLVVAIQSSGYTAPHKPPPSQRHKSAKVRDGFLEQQRPQAKEGEVWVVRVRVAPDEPARVLLTDRSRFMVGPVR